MIRFNCDYNEGAHERILQRLFETNMEQTPGYGEDFYCRQAAETIKSLCEDASADVHFLVGGTQTNLTVIDAALRKHQGVLAAETGHIQVHETGAIEACGHKVLALPSANGKITARQVEEAYRSHITNEAFEHMVQPKMVYISFPTELGTIYSKKELEDLSDICRKNRLYLFIDGARLGYGLAAADNDVTLHDLTVLSDVFYIGGTKQGALFGEALVITHPDLQEDFRYFIKQKGGMLAKGRLLGLQFQTLFENTAPGGINNTLYMQLSLHADKLSDKLRDAIREAGYPFLVESRTNQIFPIMPDALLEKLRGNYSFSYERRVDETHSAIRFCTSWATQEEAVDALIKDINNPTFRSSPIA